MPSWVSRLESLRRQVEGATGDGAATEVEITERKARVEERATRVAAEVGVVPGGCTAMIREGVEGVGTRQRGQTVGIRLLDRAEVMVVDARQAGPLALFVKPVDTAPAPLYICV